jgi:hypothetical protein
MTIVWPSNTKSIIDEIRDTIGRTVEFRCVSATITCSACFLDPVTGTSDNAFCPVCSGEYYIDTISGYSAIAHVTWSPSDILRWEPGGTMADGDCLIQVEYTDELLAVLPTVVDVVVDGKIMEIKKKMLRGVQGINRILMKLIEKEE